MDAIRYLRPSNLAEATDLIGSALRAAEVPDAVAASVAEALVAAEAEGQVGHGFSRLADYVAQVRSGKINRKALRELERERKGMA